MSETATLEAPSASATDGNDPSTPAVSVPESAETLAARKASLEKLRDEQQAIIDKNTEGIAKITARGMAEELADFVTAAAETIKVAEAKRDKAVAHLESIAKQERVAGFAQPFIAKLGVFKTELATDRLPSAIQLLDLEKDITDVESAIINLGEKRKLLKHVARAFASFPDADPDAEMPPLKVKAVDGGVSFEFATRAGRKARAASDSSAPAQARGNFRIVSVTDARVKDLEGKTIGDVPGAAYPTWQALYLDRADPATRAKLDKQSRSKREWFQKTFGATIEELPDADSSDS